MVLQHMSQLLSGMRRLQTLNLDLSSKGLGSEGVATVLGGIGKLEFLRDLKLNLTDNKLDLHGGLFIGEQLAKGFKKVSALELRLNKNDLGFAGVEAVTDGLLELPQLTVLSVHPTLGNPPLEPAVDGGVWTTLLAPRGCIYTCVHR